MAIFGDQYNYRLDVDLTGINEVGDLEREIAGLRAAQAKLTLEFQKGNITAAQARAAYKANADRLKELESVYKLTSSASGGLGKATSRAGQSLTQLTFVIDDAQYGMRGLMNQIPLVTTALFGFGPAGAAAGLALTLLAGAFREDIDEMLAWAGVLDENVVKGMDNASEKANKFREDLQALNEAFADAPKPTKDMASAVSQVFDDAGRAATDGLVKLLDIEANPQAQAAYERSRKAVQDRLKELNKTSEAILARGGDDSFLTGQFIGLNRQLDKLDEANAKRVEVSRKRLVELQKAAIGGDQGAIDQIADLAEKANLKGLAIDIRGVTDEFKDARKEADDFADAILEGEKAARDRAKAREKAIREESRTFADALKAEVDATKKAEAEKEAARKEAASRRRLEEAQARAREQLDEGTRRAVETFGPVLQQLIARSLQSSLRLGASPQQARTGAFRGASDFLERFGLGRDVAAGAAMQLVDEQAAPMRAAVDANNAAAQFARMQLQNTGFLLNAFNQSRAEFLQMMRAAEIQRRQIQANTRRFQPLRFMAGRPLGGFF